MFLTYQAPTRIHCAVDQIKLVWLAYAVLCEEDIKEELSYAVVHAVAAKAGFSCDRPHKDRDSVDAVVSCHGLLHMNAILMSPRLELQLKGHIMEAPEGDTFSFELKIKNYHELRALTHIPRLLVILALPTESRRWLEVSTEQVIARRCVYWCKLREAPDTDNTTSKTVGIRTANLFTPEQVKALMTLVACQKEIPDAL